MISLLEIAERTKSGPKLIEKEWNMSLFKKMQDLARKYRLGYSGPDLFFNVDDDYADRAFQAAVDFVVESGVCCVSTNRVVRFTQDEVRKALREVPHEITVGEGKDARRIRKREMEHTSSVSIIGGGHRPWSEKLIPLSSIVKSFVQVETCPDLPYLCWL